MGARYANNLPTCTIYWLGRRGLTFFFVGGTNMQPNTALFGSYRFSWSYSRLACVLPTVSMLILGMCLSTAMAQSVPGLRITDIHGQSWNGNLVSIDQESLVYKSTEAAAGADVIKKSDEILRIERSGKNAGRAADSTSGTWKAGLTDGSVLAVQKIVGKEKNWTIQLSDKLAQNGFAGELKYLKLKKLDAKAEEAWAAFLREDLKSDALIVVRPGGALDRVDGVIKGIVDGKIQFDVDGQIVDASVDRLAGVVWFRKQQATAPKGFRVELSNGSSLVAQRAKVAGGSLELAGSWGESLSVPIEWLQGIDCGLDKMAWLSGLDVLDSRSTKKVGFGEFDTLLSKTTRPRWVKGKGASEDLLFPGPGEYQFRAPAGMTKLQARIERANESEAQSPIAVEVWVDDQVAYRKELGAQEESLDLEVSIAPEKKIKLVLGSSSALNLGTRTLWRQPRLSK